MVAYCPPYFYLPRPPGQHLKYVTRSTLLFPTPDHPACAADASVLKYFPRLLAESHGNSDPMAPLMTLLTRSSVFIVTKAAVLLAKIVSTPLPAAADGVADAMNSYLTGFAAWAVSSLRAIPATEAAEHPKTPAAIGGMQALVSTMSGRAAAIDAGVLELLCGLLTASQMSNSASTVQLLYQTLFSLWSLSYSPHAAAGMSAPNVGLIAKIIEILKTSQKEKVLRVALATMRNLLGTGSASNDMVVHGLMPVLDVLRARKWADEDIIEDIEMLEQTLQARRHIQPRAHAAHAEKTPPLQAGHPAVTFVMGRLQGRAGLGPARVEPFAQIRAVLEG